MSVTIYKVATEFRGRLVTEHLVCRFSGAPPILFLSGSVAGAVARLCGEQVGCIVAAEQMKFWEAQHKAVVRRWRFDACAEQRDENRLVFTGMVEDDNGAEQAPVYLVLTPGLQALSSLQLSPDAALGLPQGTWEPPSPM